VGKINILTGKYGTCSGMLAGVALLRQALVAQLFGIKLW
jgi:hypothetical protein